MKNFLVKLLDFLTAICLFVGFFYVIFFIIIVFVQIYRWIFLYKKPKKFQNTFITRTNKSWAETGGHIR